MAKIEIIGENGNVAKVDSSGNLQVSGGGGGGGGAVTVADGADVTQGAKADVAWVSGDGTVISLLKKIASAGGSAVSIADGADVAQGATTDTASSSTVHGALRKIITLLPTVLVSDRLKVDGSGVTQPVSGTFWQATQPVSGTVTANQGGTWTVQPGNTANTTAWKVDGSAVTQPVSGTFWQATQPVSGTVTATATVADGADVNEGATTDAANTTGTTGTMSGKLRGIVTLLAAALKVGGSVASDAPVTDNPLLGGGRASTAVPTAVSTDGDSVATWLTRNGATVTEGSIASAGTDSGNPVKVGGVYNSTLPTFTTGQRGDLQVGTRGSLNVTIQGPNASLGVTANNGIADTHSTSTIGLETDAMLMAFNGASFDRFRANVEATLLTSAARTATVASADIVNYNGRGLHLIINVSAGTGFSITPTIQGKDPVSGAYYTILAGVPITSTGTTVLKVYPGIATIPNAASSDILPRTWRLNVTVNDATSVTYSAAAVTVL